MSLVRPQLLPNGYVDLLDGEPLVAGTMVRARLLDGTDFIGPTRIYVDRWIRKDGTRCADTQAVVGSGPFMHFLRRLEVERVATEPTEDAAPAAGE